MKNSYLVSADAKNTVTTAELKRSYGQLSALIKNGYTAYRITYNEIKAVFVYLKSTKPIKNVVSEALSTVTAKKM